MANLYRTPLPTKQRLFTKIPKSGTTTRPPIPSPWTSRSFQHFLEENDDLDHNDDDQVDGMAVGLLILGLITRIVRLDTPKHVV